MNATQRIDQYCTYSRLALQLVCDKLSDTEHQVTIQVLPDVIDKRAVLFESKREDFDKNPQKYAENNWYAGAVLIVGDLNK